jgi:hypothetical protein
LAFKRSAFGVQGSTFDVQRSVGVSSSGMAGALRTPTFVDLIHLSNLTGFARPATPNVHDERGTRGERIGVWAFRRIGVPMSWLRPTNAEL